MTDDELIAEVSRRLTAGAFGFHGLFSAEQCDYRDAWWQLYPWVFERYPHVARKMEELRDGADETVMRGINTTEYK